MNNYWTGNRLPELRNVSEEYMQALPAGYPKRRVIEASWIYECERELYDTAKGRFVAAVEQTGDSDPRTRLNNFIDRRAILRNGYLAAFRKAIGLVNTLAAFGSLTNQANRWIREPFETFGPNLFEQRGKFVAPPEWRVVTEDHS